jgi:hypothetical protein
MLTSSSHSLLDEIKRFTGVAAKESVETEGTAVSLGEIGAAALVFALGATIPLSVWSGATAQNQA